MDSSGGKEVAKRTLEFKNSLMGTEKKLAKLDSSADGLLHLLCDPSSNFLRRSSESTNADSSSEKKNRKCKKTNDVPAHPAVKILVQSHGKVLITVDSTIDLSIDQEKENEISENVLQKLLKKDIRAMRQSHNRTSYVRTVSYVFRSAVSSYLFAYTGDKLPKGVAYRFEDDIKTSMNESYSNQVELLPQPLKNCLLLALHNEHLEHAMLDMNRDKDYIVQATNYDKTQILLGEKTSRLFRHQDNTDQMSKFRTKRNLRRFIEQRN